MVESEVKKMTDYQFKAIVIQIIKNVIQEARETNKSQEEIIKEFFEEIKKAVQQVDSTLTQGRNHGAPSFLIL